jgi:hypothetical protein
MYVYLCGCLRLLQINDGRNSPCPHIAFDLCSKARAKKRLVGISKSGAAHKDGGEYERILRIEQSYMKVALGEAQWQGYFDRCHDNFKKDALPFVPFDFACSFFLFLFPFFSFP